MFNVLCTHYKLNQVPKSDQEQDLVAGLIKKTMFWSFIVQTLLPSGIQTA